MQREFPENAAVKVGSIVYDVVQEEIVRDNRESFGHISHAGSVMTLRRSLEFQQKRQTFMHELFHAIDTEFLGADLSEKDNNLLASIMCQVLADNFGLFYTLFGPEENFTQFIPLKDEAPKVTNVKGTFVAERPGTAVPGGANG